MSPGLLTHAKPVQKPSAKKAREKRIQPEPSRLFAGECSACAGKTGVLQRASSGPAPNTVPPIVHEVLRSTGQPLDANTRGFMESRFAPLSKTPARVSSTSIARKDLTISNRGDPYKRYAEDSAHRVMGSQEYSREMGASAGWDFSNVRVHTDARAAESAKAVNALAYTVGQEMVFGAGRYSPSSLSGRRLLAHELTHVVQQEGRPSGSIIQEKLEIGESDSAEERTADSVMAGIAVPAISAASGTRLSRQVVPGSVGWKAATGPNAKKSTVKGIERIPLDNLGVGHQSRTGSRGRAIVLMSSTLDSTKPVDVLLHFHGHNQGYEEAGGKVRDDSIDNIEAQLAGSSRPQLMAILPQGTSNSEFGETSLGGKKSTKSFDPDAYINNIFAVLSNQGFWKSKPSLAGVTITGHSGAGELINEKILGAALGSNIGLGATPTAGSAVPAAFKQLALFDAVNGPAEHARLSEFLQMKMRDELAKTQQKASDNERIAFLKSSFKFRAYYSHAPKIGNYYSQWHVGPVVHPKAVYSDSLQEVITKFLNGNAAALGGSGSSVYKEFEANYRIIDAGNAVHDEMMADHDHMKDTISVMPRREDGSPENQPVSIPRSVYDTLNASGKPLDDESLTWANRYFRRDMSKVRIHDDEQAAMSARAIRAKAYTAGCNIVIGQGRYAPDTGDGRRLLAHEITHIIQQDRGSAYAAPQALGSPHDALEAQADRIAATANNATSLAASKLTAGTATPSIQRSPDGSPKTVDAAMCEANANPHPAELGTCNYKEPENCPTYEGWVNTFVLLKTHKASDTPGANASGFSVFGGDLASKDFRPVANEPGPPPPPKSFAPLQERERFIDHPTDNWVQTCLPENLRATAYQLPADCADIAIILRHVWLAAHHRTQTFDRWTLGDQAGKASEKAVLDVISNVGTGQVANLVAPYSDAQGRPLRSIKQLAPLLHPGDILVWWHYDKGFDKTHTGGHTHTIAAVERDDTGALRDLTLLQGNEPIFGRNDPSLPVSLNNPARQKEDIHEFLKKEDPKRAQPSDDELGQAPGRRIEKAKASTSNLQFEDSNPETDKSPAPIWKWGRETLLIAAGPPKSAPRPAAMPQKGQKGPANRRLTDWTSPLRSAPESDLVARFESMLFEARATVEANGSLIEGEARAVGAAAGARIWELGKKKQDLANASHFKPMQDILDILWMFQKSRQIISPKADTGYDVITSRLFEQLGWIKEAFETAARGISDISFSKGAGAKVGTKNDPVNVLVTGFDPFEPSGSLRRPAAGEWNPSGAAALALDGQRLPVSSTKGAKGIAAVESIVLPVNYEAFKGGIVEQAIGPHAREVDAVLTVSEDAGLDPSKPARLERYAVGVHNIYGNLEGVPAAKGGSSGPAIIESTAPLNDIASATEAPAKKGSEGVQKPTIGEGIMFQFQSAAEADAALTALGLTAGRSAQTTISDEKALHQIISSMTRTGDSPEIKFKAGAKSFTAKVVQGPGGNFLSNEVSFRALRLLGSSSSPKDPISFHTHTQRSDAIPDDTGSADSKKNRKDAIGKALGLRAKIISTLKRIIGIVGRLVLDKRSSSKP